MLLDDLRARVGDDCLVTDIDVMESFAHDEAEWAPYGKPAVVVRARTAEDVQAVVQVCIEHQTPVIARGAGTGLSGAANAIDGCVILSLERMNKVLEVNPLERLAVVQPGVVNDHLRDHVAESGLWYPPDPASSPWSTIGGNLATNAGGMCCVKYGVTREYVLGMQLVTGTGELVRIGRRTAKGVAGYDLTGLMVGSEGTLGIATEITVRLRPLRAEEITVAGFFDTMVDAGKAVEAVAAAGLTPSALELVDKNCLKAVDDWRNMGLSVDANVVLLGRTDAPGDTGLAEAEQMVQCFTDAGATYAVRSEDSAEGDALFAARRMAYPALERLGPLLTEDVCVPKFQVPTMLGRIEEIGRRHDVLIATLAHAGDGNLHPMMLTAQGDEDQKRRSLAAFDEIIAAAIELGGTVTGEHGVGLLKLDGLAAEQAPEVLDLYRSVKRALDPHNILNPGKGIVA
ncbi:FAD-binding protein [Naumannella sp. ID2617S]|nr:FAD-binding protein [Naumannella sp. ID2617S]